jgi:hypothetical protein
MMRLSEPAICATDAPSSQRAFMNHSLDISHRDPDLFGLLYGFRFLPGERVAKSIRPRHCAACRTIATVANFFGCTSIWRMQRASAG